MSPADPRAVAEELRERAWSHETLQALDRELPNLRPGSRPAPGLYTSTIEQRMMLVDDELRATVLHLVSASGYDHRIVGEVQAAGPNEPSPRSWRLRLLVRDPATGTMVPVQGDVSWFSNVLELHYQVSGAPVSFEPRIPA